MTRILVVEDSPTQREELRFILDSQNFEVETTIDAEQALKRLASDRFDLIISDILMPGMSGYDLCRNLKANRRTKDIPIILLTTLSDPLDIIQGLECGADNFITKPYEAGYLVGRINRILTNRRMRLEGKLKVGVEIFFLGRKFTITSDKEQILDLLISTFEDIVRTNQELHASQAELARAKAALEEYARKLEERVHTSEEKYRSLMEHANDAILIADGDNTIVEANRQAAELLGSRATDLIGRKTSDVATAEMFHEHRLLDVALRRPDGASVYVDSSSARVDVGGRQLRIAILRDVTEQRQVRAQLLISDRMASVGMLAAGIAHEINTPLAAIILNLSFIAEDLAALEQKIGPLPELAQLRDELKDAVEAADRVKDIVRDVKTFSRSEDERRELVDVRGVLNSCIRMAWTEIRHRARLVKEYGETPRVAANESRLGQVFLNLLVNAAQALEDGHAEDNEIRIRTRTDDRGRAVIEVEDTGPGIPPHVKKNLFTPFFTTKPPGVGTGLGLSICHRIVTSLGGEIELESEPGRGTLFRVMLPPARDLGSTGSVRPAKAREASRRGRVLVVDDEPMIGSAVARMLAGEHEVHSATRAEVALERIRSGERFDIILCDLMMPQMSGMEFHERLLELAPDQASVMIFVTGGAFTAQARAFLDDANRPRIEKPFDIVQLRAMINERVR